jgi:repressor LexA
VTMGRRPGKADRDASGLTAVQRKVLATIKDFIDQHQYPPTIEELRTRLDLASLSSVYHHLRTLQAKGLITWTPGRYRTLRLTEQVKR